MAGDRADNEEHHLLREDSTPRRELQVAATHLACHIYGMKKTTLYVGDEELALLKKESEREGVSQGAIITRALRSYFRSRGRKARSVGAGRSGRGDLSEQAEALLEGLGEEK